MAVIVQKYGGSSVADVEKLRRVAQKVAAARRGGDDVVVVVSAMGKTTDELLALAKRVDETPPRRELDMLLTTGERVSMALLSMAVQKLGFDAISFTGSQSGIITNDRHFDARIIEVRPHRIEDELARGRVVIVAGYQGMSYRREITTLGRGGSDTTALALAAALGAERAEIYSDVDGVYSADPRVVPEAVHLPEIGYEEMQEMASVGAKVLHARAVEFARAARIAIHARSTFEPGRETVVHDAAGGRAAVAIVAQRSVARVEVRGGVREALRLAEARGLEAQETEIAGDDGAFLVATATSPEWRSARRELEDALGARASIVDPLALVSVVGARAAGPALGPLLAALESAGVRALRASTGPLRASALVEDGAADLAARALHAAFVVATR